MKLAVNYFDWQRRKRVLEIGCRVGNFMKHRRYSRKSLREVAERAGLIPERLRYMNSVGFFNWWVNAHILKRTEQSTSQILFFDSTIVPLLASVENRVRPPFGQSLFAVLVKGSA